MATMRATLMLMLLLGAVVAAHGHKVSCENKCEKPVKLNGITIAAKAVVVIDVLDLVTIEVVDVTGVKFIRKYYCPKDVTALVVLYEGGFVKVKVVAALIVNLINLVLGLFRCNFY